jgi:hypothetical protein
MSVEQGLLLLSNPLCLLILRSCLARAAHLYKVDICHFLVNATHIHMVFVVINPEHACKFIGYFKAEVAHRINIIFGWKKRTVWCEGYDSPVVLTPIRALMTIAYLYANPAKDNLEQSIDHFPGLSSWKMYRRGELLRQWKFVRRPAFSYLPKDAHTLEGYTREARRISSSTKKTHIFELKPDAWLEAFGVTSPEERSLWNQRVVERVRTLEARALMVRAQQGRTVIGHQKLLRQRITFDYHPTKRSGRRMWCLSEKRSVRVRFIEEFKELLRRARRVYERWHVGDYSIPYPLGLFPPSQPRLCELLAVR